MIQRLFNLHLHAGHKVPLVINANQYDSGEQWLFTLYNGAVQYTPSSGAIVGIKSDRLGIINSGTVDANGRVVINETKQMTAAVGKNVFELLIDDQTHGTANFIVLVEPKPGDNADFSASDLSLLQQAIDGTSETAIKEGVSEWMTENMIGTSPAVDSSLSITGAAADAKKTGDEISALKSAIDDSGTASYMYVEGTTLYMGDNMTETISITENGTYNVKKYASANVNVPTSGGGSTPTGTKQISITENGTTVEDVASYASAQISVNVPTGGGFPLSLKRAVSKTMEDTYTSSNRENVTFDPLTDSFTNWVVLAYMPKPASDGTNPIEWVCLKTSSGQNYGAMVRANGTDGTDSNAVTVTTESLQSGYLQVGGQYGYFVSGYTYQFYIFTD